MVMSQSVSAIGVGQVKVKSFLNEPLSLELPITGSNSEDVSVAMASYQQAERLGVSAVGLHNFKARVVEEPSGKKIVITSNQPYKEPVADLAIVLRFPGGELVKGVSAFIDPAGFNTSAAATPASNTTINQPSVTQSQVAQQTSGDVLTTVSQQRATGLPAAQIYQQQNTQVWGPTQRNDSLWKIASQLRSQYEVSQHQLMMAIFQINPQAFSNGRIDRLKMGYMLNLPNQQQAAALTNNQAVALFAAASRGSVAIKAKPVEQIAIPRTQQVEPVAKTVLPISEVVATKPPVTSNTSDQPGDNQVDTQQLVALQQRLQETKAIEQSLQQENVVLKQQLDQVMQRVERIQSRYAQLESETVSIEQQQSQQVSKTPIPQTSANEPVFVRDESVASETSAVEDTAASAVATKRNYGLYLLMFLGICSLAFISLLSFYIFKRRKRRALITDDFARFEKQVEAPEQVQQPVAAMTETRKRSVPPSLEKVNRDAVNFDMVRTSAEAYFAYGRYKDAIELIEFEMQKRQDQPEIMRLLNEYLADLEARINDAQSSDDVAEYFVDEDSEAQLAEDDLQALQDSVLEELEHELKVSKDKLSKKAS